MYFCSKSCSYFKKNMQEFRFLLDHYISVYRLSIHALTPRHVLPIHRYIQNSIKNLRWSFLRK